MNANNFKEPVLVSACLVGIDCRYDGKNCYSKEVAEYLTGRIPIIFCPEVFGGLPVPRERCEIENGDGMDVLDKKSRIISARGVDLAANFINGSMAGLKACILAGVKRAILKEKSPSCGVRKISSNGKIKDGMGVFAALLVRNNIEVISSEDIQYK